MYLTFCRLYPFNFSSFPDLLTSFTPFICLRHAFRCRFRFLGSCCLCSRRYRQCHGRPERDLDLHTWQVRRTINLPALRTADSETTVLLQMKGMLSLSNCESRAASTFPQVNSLSRSLAGNHVRSHPFNLLDSSLDTIFLDRHPVDLYRPLHYVDHSIPWH